MKSMKLNLRILHNLEQVLSTDGNRPINIGFSPMGRTATAVLCIRFLTLPL